MLKQLFRNVLSHKLGHYQPYSSNSNKNPFTRTWQAMSKEVNSFFVSKDENLNYTYPEHADIVIIGGGFIGSAVAYWLRTRAGEGLRVVVLEKDLTFKNSLNNIGLGVLNQHYSLPENIELAQVAADFLRKSEEYLGQHVNIQYNPHGHLVLASEKHADKLETNATLLMEHGFKSEMLSREEIKSRFPWINTSDVAIGCIGNENEGVFNASHLLNSLIQKSVALGTEYVNAEAIGFESELQRDVLIEGIAPGKFNRLTKVKYRTLDNEEHTIQFSCCILAAGLDSASIAQMADIGTGDGLLSVPLPLVTRPHHIYSIKDGGQYTGLDTPFITDTSGLWLHRNGIDSNLICGHVPLMSEDSKKLSEEDCYNLMVKPSLWNRFPESKNVEVVCMGTELYSHNTYDDNGFVGPHPHHTNLFLATGFAKDGGQQAIGVGRAVAELIIDNSFTTADLTRFSFDRLLVDEPVIETNIY